MSGSVSPEGTTARGQRGPATDGGPPPWRAAVRDVLLAAALVVGVVLGAAVLTSLLPIEGQRVVFHTPLAIAVLMLVTGWVLWRAAGRRPPPE